MLSSILQEILLAPNDIRETLKVLSGNINDINLFVCYVTISIPFENIGKRERFFYVLKGYKNVTLRTNGLGLRHKLISLRFTMFYSYFNPLIVKVAII